METRTVASAKAADAADAGLEADSHEVEQQFILRLPSVQAEKLHRLLDDGNPELRDRFLIQFEQDLRHATVQLDDDTLKGVMVDLPCIIESLKTFDRKTFYKITDISQMLLVKPEGESFELAESGSNSNSNNAGGSKKPEKKFLWNHGITPPLKNVRRRRFRKTRKKKFTEDAVDLDKELKRLLRADMEAVSVRWELKTAKERREHQAAAPAGGGIVVKSEVGRGPRSTLREHDLFGGQVSSSSESEEEGEAMARELMGQLRPHKPARLKLVPHNEPAPMNQQLKQEQSSLEASLQFASAEDEQLVLRRRQVLALETQLETLRLSVEKVQQQKRLQEAQIKTLENPALRERMISDLEGLSDEESAMKSQMYNLEVQLESWKLPQQEDVNPASAQSQSVSSLSTEDNSALIKAAELNDNSEVVTRI